MYIHVYVLSRSIMYVLLTIINHVHARVVKEYHVRVVCLFQDTCTFIKYYLFVSQLPSLPCVLMAANRFSI